MADVTRLAATIAVCWTILLLLGPDHFNGVDPDETMMQRLENRLYFTVSTLSTVGYGDITPKSTAARAMASGMMVLILLGSVA